MEKDNYRSTHRDWDGYSTTYYYQDQRFEFTKSVMTKKT